MPKSHDRKPRNRWRRVKAKQSSGTLIERSDRHNRRRLRGRSAFDAERTRQAFEVAARKAGYSWRDVEIAVQSQADGKWSSLDRIGKDMLINTRADRRAAA